MLAVYLTFLSITIWTDLGVSALALPSSGTQNIQQAYTPQISSCSSNFQLVRSAGAVPNQTIGSNESAYISARESNVLPDAFSAYLQNVNSTNTTLPGYVSNILSSNNSLPRLGIAISGGGYRAAIFGAGVMNALDGRNQSSQTAGTGGLLQAATYLTSLSGGSWLVSSAMQANFPTLPTVVFGPEFSNATEYGGWNANFSIISPANSTADNLQYLEGIVDEISGKKDAGFPVTITDFWARLLARHFCNGTHAASFFDNTQSTHGAGILLSDLANLSTFQNHEVPFPIIIADSVSSGQNESNVIPNDTVPLTNTVYEFTPFEMGSFDPTLSAFTPTKFLGTTNTSECVTGFDQLAYIFGTSSGLFNTLNVSSSSLADSIVGDIFSLLIDDLPQTSVELDLSLYPNAFFGVSSDTFIDSDEEFLGLVDGGENGEVLPLQPLLVKARQVDTIFAVDASADTSQNFAAGLSLIATQNRTSFFPSAYSFPQVPTTPEEFINDGLTSHPTFFGCNDSSPTPLVIYLANGAPPSGQTAVTNTSTLQIQYEDSEIQSMLDQTFVIATQGFPANSSQTVDPEWPACLACAVVDRVRAREGTGRSGVCEGCLSRYCWFP